MRITYAADRIIWPQASYKAIACSSQNRFIEKLAA